jgi:ubiquitin thioesterase OTU1
MRARFKAPSGTGVLELPNDATIQDVFDEIRARTEISSFSLKFGPPMAMKTISAVDSPHPATSFGLHGETLTVVPDAARPEHPASLTEPQESGPMPGEKPEDAVVPWPEREGTLRMCPDLQRFSFVTCGLNFEHCSTPRHAQR